jgi:8-oxo-dGTP pyrophosphatase MutT (NUDIX family)
LKNHRGQVSFPGGAREIGDKDEVATALREASEEIGILSQSVDILGQMGEFLTVSNYLVTPVIGVLEWPIPLSVSSYEVSKVFTIPLTWLSNKENWEERIYEHPNGWHGSVIFYQSFDDEILWGISAKITVEFITEVVNKKEVG